jgi:hypothetical protein
MMEAARTSETSVDNYFTRQYIPEDKSEILNLLNGAVLTQMLNNLDLFHRRSAIERGNKKNSRSQRRNYLIRSSSANRYANTLYIFCISALGYEDKNI